MWRNFGIFCGKMKFLEVFGWKVGICGGSFVGKLRGMREISLGFWWKVGNWGEVLWELGNCGSCVGECERMRLW